MSKIELKKTQHQLIDNYFYDSAFLKRNEFFVLNKNEFKLDEYVRKIQDKKRLKLTNRLKTLKIISDRIVKENNKKRLGNATGLKTIL
ncbi:MAG: hypothetical protein LBC92_02915 [Rickettsiales bacterium]|jgi:hypothetical protein|nr:hypothetical protein [Rickettsiales bacterium]